MIKKFSTVEFLKTPKKIIFEGGWVLTGQIFVTVVNLIGIRIVTEFLPAQTLGTATMWLGISVLLKNIFIMPLLNYQIRFYPEYVQKKKITAFNRITLRLIIWLIILSSLLFFIATIILISFNFILSGYVILTIVVLFFLVDALKSFYINKHQAERKQKYYALWLIVESFLTYTLIYVLISNFPSAEVYLLSMSVGTLLGIVIFRDYKINKNQTNEIHNLNIRDIIYEAKKFSLPFIPMAFLSWIMNLSSRYFIGFIGSTYEAGIFIASFSIASRPFIMLSGIATLFFRPILLEAFSKDERKKINFILRSWIIAILFLGLLTLVILIFGNKLIAKFFLSSEYRINTLVIFFFVGLGYFLLAIYQIFENFLFAMKKTKEILLINIIGTFTFLITNFLLVTKYAITGAVISITISFALQLAAVIAFFIFQNGGRIVR